MQKPINYCGFCGTNFSDRKHLFCTFCGKLRYGRSDKHSKKYRRTRYKLYNKCTYDYINKSDEKKTEKELDYDLHEIKEALKSDISGIIGDIIGKLRIKFDKCRF